LTVKPADPGAVGVPDIAPPAERVSPAGRDPEATDHEYGGDPPDAPSVWEYAAPAVPAGKDEVVTDKAGGLTVKESAAVVEAEVLSVTLTVKPADPAAPGVPDMAPAAERVSPAGRDPEASDHEYGGEPPEAPSACK
jgi:hypothetical protein